MKHKKIRRESQEALIETIGNLKLITVKEACRIIGINHRRYYRWQSWKETEKQPAWNKILPDEESAILEAARDEKLCDLRAAGLMVYGQDSDKFYCSISTVQRILIRNKLQVPYIIPRRKKPKKPEVRELMKHPNKIYSYDATEFYLTNRLRVIVITILDMYSRKNIHYGVKVRSFTQNDVMRIWDEALESEGIETKELTVLSDRGSQMKGSRTTAHLIGEWDLKLEYARPYTPDDNAWVETFIKRMKYHPECPDEFDTVQDVANWIARFKTLHNDYPHSSLGYVRPNDEYEGRGEMIRQRRKSNLQDAKNARLANYHLQQKGESQKKDTEEFERVRISSEQGHFIHNSSA